MGRVTNYRSKINGLIDVYEQKMSSLGDFDDFGRYSLEPDEEDEKFHCEYSIKELEKVIRLLDSLKLVGCEEGPGFCNKVAEATGYSRNRVSDMLSGNASLNQRFVKAACSAFGTSEEYIMEGKGAMATVITVSPKESFAMKEAVRLLTTMTEPERLRAVAMLMEMAQDK